MLEKIMGTKELSLDPYPRFGKYKKYLRHTICYNVERGILTINVLILSLSLMIP